MIAVDCAFCTEFSALPGSGQGKRVICEVSGWVLLPTVGCFTPGYCLFMPLDHIDAAADAPPDELSRVGAAAEDMRALISSVFGPVIIAEHGPRGCELGAGCCSHAHLHLIPVPDPGAVTAAYRATGGPGHRLENLAGLPGAVEGPYLYVSPQHGEHLLWPSPGFARQYVRRVCAAQHEMPDRFDWRDHPFEDNQALTITRLRPAEGSMTSSPATAGPATLLSTLTPAELTAADRRYPKWATMCQLRRIGLAVLDAVLITPGQDNQALGAAIAALAAATGQDRVMVRSDGGIETRRYYKGGNTFPLDTAASKAAGLLEAGRAVILMEPANRFTNRLTALLRMDRYGHGRDGTFTVEALGPGYDVADLTRGGIPPQVTVTADLSWSAYPDLWWSDLSMTARTSPGAEEDRRSRRLARIAADILTDTGHLIAAPMTTGEQVAAAEAWLRERSYNQLWTRYDTAAAVAQRVRHWFDDAFMIAACHPNRGWTCLATANSDLGDRTIYWDIVDGSRKYAIRRLA